MALPVIAAISAVENVAMSSALRAASWIELSNFTCAEDRASTCWVLKASICHTTLIDDASGDGEAEIVPDEHALAADGGKPGGLHKSRRTPRVKNERTADAHAEDGAFGER